ncbi:Eukaryotic translation initiation factor 4E-binding protein 2 [Clonorchis sinensis]|uniref:Eukaryotic translation initiation factor 4E-binding protein 1 n=2 Tax=Clonorchis sinensis TaxID=79923 RepID=G7YC71_CLOSI|nr:Eukaryotic translation initiation factor 4E-binding protein 2 [Clonorchis sinensis]GAA50560.1 eukaryotic translation initiation factor 4E-binding protein 1 [Clonorchis sinensis]
MDQKATDAIPVRRVRLTDPSQLPQNLGTTPGGTLFSTTPGGTRVVYDRDFMLHCKGSPVAQTPPSELPKMPGFSVGGDVMTSPPPSQEPIENGASKGEEHPFDMDL